MSAAENVIHALPYLRKEGGFSSSYPKEGGELAEKLKAQAEEADPAVPNLRTINEENAAIWKTRVVGEKTLLGKDGNSHAIVVWEN